MFAKVFIWLVIVVVVDSIMVPIYDPPPRPPCATYQNNPVGNAEGNKENGYYGAGHHGNGYQVRAAHELEYPATNDHSFSAESSETGHGIYPTYAYHAFY